MRRSWRVACLTGALALAFAESSSAAPATAGALQIGGGFRYGFEMNDGDFNPWGPGLGLQVGYTLPLIPIYVGGNAEYFFGDKQDLGPGSSVEGNIWQVTAEGGYDLGLGPLVIRPKLGLGFANSSAKVCIPQFPCADDSSTNFVAAPGLTVLLMPGRFTLMGDLRYDLVFSGTSPSSDPQRIQQASNETIKAVILTVGIGF